MEETPKSKGEMVIENLMRELDPGSDRYRVLETAKRFKSSWVELGEKLLGVQRDGLFRQWGYDSFEDYCSREVRIKKPTAQKLTLAYRYLEKEEPQLLARETELKPLPDYRSVDLLRQAREEKGFPEEDYAGLRQAVLEEERSHPTVLKRFKEMEAARNPQEPAPRQTLRSALSAARRLESALDQLAEVPQDYQTTLNALSAWLGEELDRLPSESADSNPS